jgi:hypothetical protein
MKKTAFSFSKESENPGVLCKNSFLLQEIKKLKKLNDYQKMAFNFPNGNLGKLFVEFLNSLSKEDSLIIANGLYSLTNPHQLTIDLYKNRDSVWGRMFDIAARGSGKGEILIIWLIKDAIMNGGGDSYDININGDKYEVKDWSMQKNSSILAGVKSKVTNFEFWDEIVDTIKRIEKLTKHKNGKPKFKLDGNFDPKIIIIINKIKKLKAKILSGEFNLSDIKLFKEFYTSINQIKYKGLGYTNIVLRGPNKKPINLSVAEFKDINPINNSINLKIINHSDTIYILTELRRLKYVRNPKLLDIDMQKAVDSIIGDVTYIVFRENAINITTEFVPRSITISSIKFIEKKIFYQ